MSSTTNLSCLLYGPGDARFEDRPVPEIEDRHDVLIRMAYVGVCGSDVHFWTHGGITRKASEESPIVMGHEASGVVEAIGPGVTSVKPGDRVAIEPGFPCRRCTRCKSGKYNLCPDMRFAADPPGNHGTLCRIYRAPEDFLYKIPESLSLQEAVMAEPLSVAVHGARLSSLQAGQTVLIQGSGTIGLLAAAVCRAFGASAVYIADINKAKLEFASSFVDCSTLVSGVSSSSYEESERFKHESGLTGGFDIVLECTGVESSVQTGLHALASGGTFVQIGMGKPDQTIPMGVLCEKEVNIKTSFRYGAGDYDTALRLLESGKVSVKAMISSSLPFERTTEAWELTKSGKGIKNLIKVND